MDITRDRKQLKASDEADEIEQVSNVKMVLLSRAQSSISWRKVKGNEFECGKDTGLT